MTLQARQSVVQQNGTDGSVLEKRQLNQPTLVKPSEARHARMAQSSAQVVAVLMRDPNFRTLPLADLEWLVLPAVMSGQFKLGHARAQPGPSKDGGTFVPVAVAMWARVSPDVDKALSENLHKPIRLKANQWVSGNIDWVIAVAGDQRTLPAFLQQLSQQEFKGKCIKMRARTPEGKIYIRVLGTD